MKRLVIFTCVAACVAGALALRVAASWDVVFTPQGVAFQENDAWFHVRTVHNLLAHFPHRSMFDPYALFPGGQEIPTGPLWDFMLSGTAWALAFGSPSPAFAEAVAAWLPAVIGALFPIAAFFLARRLYGERFAGRDGASGVAARFKDQTQSHGVTGESAGLFAALWIAVSSGGFLWITHLGLADHHAAEGFFAFLALALLCEAMERRPQSGRLRFSILGGCAMGAFLAVRPAGVFIPAILACATAIEPLLAPVVLPAALAAAIVFLPVAGALWSEYTILALGAAAMVSGGALILSRYTQRRVWFLAAAAGVLLATCLARPHMLLRLWFEVRRVAGFTPQSRVVAAVQEMLPIYRLGHARWWQSVIGQAGFSWLLALPALLLAVLWLWRTRRPALLLFAVWSVVATIGTVMETRMLIYFVPVAAVLAGGACSRIARRPLAWAAAAAIVGINLFFAIPVMEVDRSPGDDWRTALTWLRQNSPEPFGDADAWLRYDAAPSPAGALTSAPKGWGVAPKGWGVAPKGWGVAPKGWGVAVWWDRGYAVEEIAHRIPMSNGTQAGAEDMARFFLNESPESAVGGLREAGGRYVMADRDAVVFEGSPMSFFPAQVTILGRDPSNYFQGLYEPGDEGKKPVRIYLTNYFHTMAARLYLHDGAAVKGTGPWVFEIDADQVIQWSRHFDSEEEAQRYMADRRNRTLIMGCRDATQSCVDLPAVGGVRHVYSADSEQDSPSSRPSLTAVKIFEVTR